MFVLIFLTIAALVRSQIVVREGSGSTRPIGRLCSCTATGESASANVSYNGYAFRGCGAHTRYRYEHASAGYEVVWCYAQAGDYCDSDFRGECPKFFLGSFWRFGRELAF